MSNRFSPLHILLYLALGLLGYFVPPGYPKFAVFAAMIVVGIMITTYKYTRGSKKNAKAELIHRLKLAPKVWPHRIFLMMSAIAGFLGLIYLLRPETYVLAALAGMVMMVFWLFSRVIARHFLGGASSWSLFIGTAPIFRLPGAPEPEQPFMGPMTATFGPLGERTPMLDQSPRPFAAKSGQGE